MNQNTKAETLSQLEARGRVFASALLDAGFNASEVRDAAWAPFHRLMKRDNHFQHTEMYFGASDLTRGTARRWSNLEGFSKEAPAWAFAAGVLAVIEERA
jgi:hypothetical protein